MKLNDIFETAAAGMTSVASIGQVEYAAWPDRVELYKRDQLGCAKCVAKIKRKKKDEKLDISEEKVIYQTEGYG